MIIMIWVSKTSLLYKSNEETNLHTAKARDEKNDKIKYELARL